jgi:DNA-binding NarL/FixJ family response regulator
MIVDDHEVVRKGLEAILRQCDDLEVVGVAVSGEQALRLVGSLDADVVLLDLKLPDMHGLDVIPELIQRGRQRPRVLVLTVQDDDEIVLRAVRGGADGYVLKQASKDELVGAIRRVASGGQFFDEVVVRAFLDEERRQQESQLLTERELEVVKLVASGMTNREIGEHLFLSADTVKAHLEAIYRKLGVADRAHAVAVAFRKGLVT